MRCFLRLFIIILVVVHSPEFATADEKDILSQEERQWLIKHDGKIRYAPLPNYPPIEFVDSDSTHQGVTADYLRRIEQKLDFRFAKAQANSWNEIIEKAKQGEIDVIGSIHNTPERKEYLMFTKPYLEIPNVIIVREEYHRPLTLEKMGGMKVVIVKGYASFSFIKNNHPKLIIEPVSDDLAGLQMVSFGRADAIITDLSVASYLIEQMKISNLRVAGTIGYAWNITFASRKDWPILNNILEKGLAAIDQKERQAIYSKWVPSGYEDLFPRKKLLLYIAIILSITVGGIVLIFILNRMLKRQVIQKTVQLQKELEERKRADEALKESEERFRTMFDNAIDGILLADTEEKRFHTGNKSICQMLGYTLEEIKNMRVMDIHPKEDLPYVIEQFEKLSMKEITLAKAIPVLRKDGTIFYADINSSVVSLAGKIYLLGIFRDITERKRATEAIQQSEEKMRIIIESSPIGIRIAQQGRYAFVNNSFLQMFGYDSPDEILGLPIETLYVPEQRQLVKKRQQDRLSGKDISALFEGKGLKKNGRIFEMSIWQTKIDFEGEPATLAFLINVSEERSLRRQLEQALKMEAIGTLAGGIAHDFNNILSAILGYTELAINSVDDKKALLEKLQEIFKAGNRAKDLVKQILAFSRQSEQELRPIQVKLIVKEALKLLRPSLPTTIEIRTNIQSDALIMADSTQIHQVLMNLCTNAGHAMQEEGGILEISLIDIRLDSNFTYRHPDIKPGAFLKLTVGDTGHGIAPDLLDKIFDPFFTTKEKGEGTGMGLSVVHGIVKSLGGTITVYSEPEKGAEFNVYLPVIEREVKDAQGFEAPLPIGTERILFVDDEQPIRDISKKLLESLGYHVEVRSNAIEALEVFRANPERFDLIITDMTMPNMTGDRLAEQLMAVRPDIPVILCTGFSARMDKGKANAMGIRAFALKPVIKRDIAKIIRKVLDEVKS